MNRRVTSFLLGLNLLLAAGLALLWFSPLRSTQWQPTVTQAPNLDDARAAVLRSRSDVAAGFPQIAERPLFSASRRPPPPPATAAAVAAPPSATQKTHLEEYTNELSTSWSQQPAGI